MELYNGSRASFEVRYIDINDSTHTEKTLILQGFDEEEVKEDFLNSNLEDEENDVINEPNVIIVSVTRLGDKSFL